MAPWGLSCSYELTKLSEKRSEDVFFLFQEQFCTFVLSPICIIFELEGANALLFCGETGSLAESTEVHKLGSNCLYKLMNSCLVCAFEE